MFCHFRYLLEGKPFIINIDHQPTVHAFTKFSDAVVHPPAVLPLKHSRIWMYHPVHPLQEEVWTDAVYIGIDYKELAALQQQDPEMDAYRTTITSLWWRDVPFISSRRTLVL